MNFEITNIRIENLIALRKKIKQSDVSIEIQKMGNYLAINGRSKAGCIMTTTFGIETNNGEPLLDMGILIPINNKIECDGEYRYIQVFEIEKAVHTKHEGSPSKIQESYDMLVEYLKQNNLIAVTPAYNVYINELQIGDSLESMTIDIYIGVQQKYEMFTLL